MIVLPMALPFVVLVLAALVAILGFRKTSVWVWFLAVAVLAYVFQGHISGPLNIAL